MQSSTGTLLIEMTTKNLNVITKKDYNRQKNVPASFLIRSCYYSYTEHISHLVLVFLLLTLNMWLPAGKLMFIAVYIFSIMNMMINVFSRNLLHSISSINSKYILALSFWNTWHWFYMAKFWPATVDINTYFVLISIKNIIKRQKNIKTFTRIKIS